MYICKYVCVYIFKYMRTYSYNRVSKSVIKRDLEGISMEHWQREWETTNKGGITKEYFPKVAERLHTKINLTQNFTTIVTGHGNIKSYLHRFKIIDTPNCPCGNGNQTTEHITRMYNTTRRQRTFNSRSSKNK